MLFLDMIQHKMGMYQIDFQAYAANEAKTTVQP
jgi:hypothetical protein